MTQYFHFIGSCGSDRYFKVDFENNKCTQIVLSAGNKKKGRPHCYGISHLALASFRGNYYWYFGRKNREGASKLLITTVWQYHKAFNKVIQEL
jgi:hypothetical protein